MVPLLPPELRRLARAPSADAFERLARIAARSLGAADAFVSLLEEGTAFAHGPSSATPGWARHAFASGSGLCVEDARDHPLTRDDADGRRLGVGSVLGAPLVATSGDALGGLFVFDRRPRRWTRDEADHLADLARGAAAEAELRAELAGLRLSEERLRLLESVVVNANDAILITQAEPIDPPGPRIVYVNDAFTRMTGYGPDDTLGRTPRMLHGPNTDKASTDKIRRALKRWRPIRIEVLNYRKDGSEFWVELSIVPVADASGWFTHWVSVQRDVGQRKQVERELNAAKELAESANRAKSVFLSRMSHELRTPLNAVLGFGQLLELDGLTDDQRENADQIRKAGRHLLGLVNEVLDIARVESGDASSPVEAVDAAQALGESLALIRPIALQAGVRLPPPPVAGGPNVMADFQRLKQVFLNLLSNAVKHNRRGGTVEVRLVDSADGSRRRVEVIDDGPGIADELRGRLFTPFDRLGAEQTAVEGTGLGLALSKRLTEAMGGELGLAPWSGAGCTFWVELPKAEPGATAEAVADGIIGPPAVVKPAGTLLYIEDNLSNCRLVERILLRRPGVKLLVAMQGGVGFELAREHRPDLIVLDVHLPDIDGREVLARLRAEPRTRRLPVVALSADATPAQAERMTAAGAERYLTKPLDVVEFLGVLDAYLEGAGGDGQ